MTKIPYFGAILNTYEFYDRPLLFSCIEEGQHYIGALADSAATVEVWLYVAISPARLAQVDSGAISFYEAFRWPEDDTVTAIRSKNGEQDTRKDTPADAVPLEWLPLEGEYA